MREPPAIIDLNPEDLTPDGKIYCPNPRTGMDMWSAHPRVFFLVPPGQDAQCPYCSTVYRLKGDPDSVVHSTRTVSPKSLPDTRARAEHGKPTQSPI